MFKATWKKMKEFVSRHKAEITTGVTTLAAAGSAAAADTLDVSTITLSVAPLFALAVIVYTALAALFPVRKGIKLLNRS